MLTLAGFAGPPPIGAFSLETVRKDIAGYIREKKLERPVIVGHSLGGFLTYWLGASEPDLVGLLVVVDGLPYLGALLFPTEDGQAIAKRADGIRQRMLSASKDQFQQQNKSTLQYMITDPRKVEMAAAWGSASDQATVAQAYYELLTKDLRPEIEHIQSPVLLIASFTKEAESARPRAAVQESYEKQIAKIPNHKLVIPENAKHFVMLDAPDWLFSQMDRFLTSAK